MQFAGSGGSLGGRRGGGSSTRLLKELLEAFYSLDWPYVTLRCDACLRYILLGRMNKQMVDKC